VSYFPFPKDAKLRKQWIIKIRRDEEECFEIKPHTKVCSLHFLPSDYEYFPFSGKRFLYEGKIPTVFDCWKNVGRGDLVKKGKPRKENRLQAKHRFMASAPVSEATECVENDQSEGLDDVDELTEPEAIQSDLSGLESGNIFDGSIHMEVVEKLSEKELDCKILNEKIRSLTSELDAMKLELRQCEFAVDNVRPSNIVFFTGFPSIEVFNAVLEFINPGENGQNVIMANLDGQSSSLTCTPSSKRGRPRKLTPRNMCIWHVWTFTGRTCLPPSTSRAELGR
jgi:hypothetical protein